MYGGIVVNPKDFPMFIDELGVKLSKKQIEQFQIYADFLISYNESTNLTAITSLEDIYEKHFYDSLLIGEIIKPYQSLCDVGSGAGFPAIPLKIVYPELSLTILEPIQKKVKFLNLLADKLQMDVNVVNMRAEEAMAYRETFDVVTARAVAYLNILAELCIPLVKKEGIFIAMKGSKAEEEIKSAEKAIITLGCELEAIQNTQLSNQEKRCNIIYRKKRKTNVVFPRKYAVIKKKPL